ncbi:MULTISPECIES: BA14K family protein [unclassified Rhizobium]|uniref:BA14K family protein n=1 Tax=unclassified Rhizobium TaxID=2613769 RepID=UPI0007F1424D|nr:MULTISPECIES: BA14K family protein [unclassified Rhizobium]ANK86415.1 BA14K-like protein [Rhizobium sp. N731]ANL16661.1 BA14K-like protein [Rhizobium sp. N1314]
MRKLTVAALCLIIGAPGITPAQAFPAMNPPKIEAQQQQIEQVRWRGRGGHHRRDNLGWALGGLAVGTIIGSALSQPYYGSPYRYYGSPYGYYDSPYRYYGSPYRYYGSPYRYYGPPYRYYGRYYAPPYRNYASTVYYGRGGSHVSWCYARYRSYRAFDNTFQPYYGPRRQCISPY